MSVLLVPRHATETYNWECNNAICQEVVIQLWQICSTSNEEFNGSRNLDGKRVAALDHSEVFFLLLLELAGLVVQVLDDLGGAIDGDQRGDVVERRVAGQESRVRRRQKLLVDGLERHDYRRLVR